VASVPNADPITIEIIVQVKNDIRTMLNSERYFKLEVMIKGIVPISIQSAVARLMRVSSISVFLIFENL
jgi:hypothetical protein